MRIICIPGRRAADGVMFAVDGAAYFTDVASAVETAFDALAESMRTQAAPSVWSAFSHAAPKRRDALCSTCGAVHRTDITCPLTAEIEQERRFRTGRAA